MGTPPCSLSVFSGPSLPNQPCTLSSPLSVWLLLHRRCHTRTTQPNTSLLTRCLYESHVRLPDHRLHISQTRRLQQILPMELLLWDVSRSRCTEVQAREQDMMLSLPGDTTTHSLWTLLNIINIRTPVLHLVTSPHLGLVLLSSSVLCTILLPPIFSSQMRLAVLRPSLQTSPYITNIIISSLPAIILSICDFNLCPPIPANKKTKMLYEMFLL